MRCHRAGFRPRRRTRAVLGFSAECQGGLDVGGPRALLGFAAECQGGLATEAKLGFAAECQGGLETRALLGFGAECSGYLEVDAVDPTYPNGFENFLEFLIPAESVLGSGTLNNCLLCIDDTFADLRTVANGGYVQHASGYDMRMELADGTVVPFARLAWSATTGRIVLRARLASLSVADTRIRLFFGKSVTTDGASPGGAYASHLTAPDIVTGGDRTGLSRTWTPTGLTAGTLAGYSATFNGSTSQLVRANPTELNGLSSITVQAVVQLSSVADNQPIFLAGPTTGTDYGLFLRFKASDKRLVFSLWVGASSTLVESVDNVMPAVGVPMLVAATWTSGQAPKLYANGALLALSAPGTALTGTVNATLGAASSEAVIGYSRVTATRFAGQIADLMVSARVLSEGHLQTQERNYLTPRYSYGVGERNSADTVNTSPIVPPIFATATVGVDAEVDPALEAYEADVGQVKTLESHTGAAGGTFSRVGGRARFRASAVGTWPSIATVKDSAVPAKRSAAPIIWVALPSSTGYPKAPPPAVRTLAVPSVYPTIEAAYAAAADGDHIVLANGSYAGGVLTLGRNIGGSGVVIRSANPLGATISRQIIGVAGRGWWLHDLILGANITQKEQGAVIGNSDFKVTKCRVTSSCGVYVVSNSNATNNSAGSFQQASNFLIGWNSFKGRNSTGENSNCHVKLRLFDNMPDGGAEEFRDFAIYRNYFYDPDPGNDASTVREVFNIYIGNTHAFGPPDNDYFCSTNGIIEYNMFDAGNRRRTIYLKRGVEYVRYNHVRGFKNEPFTQRHGWGTKWWGNRCSQAGGDFLVGGGRLYGSVGATDCRGNVITGGFHIKPGTSNGTTNEQAADYALFVGNTCGGETILGHRRDNNFVLDPTQGGKIDNARIFEHSGAVTPKTGYYDEASCDVRTGFTGHGLTIPSAVTLTATDVGLETAGQ